jgi:excisionase family DNA binding protein
MNRTEIQPSSAFSGKLMTVPEVAAFLGLSRAQVYRLSEFDKFSNRLPFVQVGGVRRYDPADIRSWIEGNKH